MKHDEYIRITGSRDDHNVSKHASTGRGITPSILIKDNVDVHVHKDHVWPPNTCLIVGDSILNNLDESKLTKKNRVVKVRAFPGSNICIHISFRCYVSSRHIHDSSCRYK